MNFILHIKPHMGSVLGPSAFVTCRQPVPYCSFWFVPLGEIPHRMVFHYVSFLALFIFLLLQQRLLNIYPETYKAVSDLLSKRR